MPNINGLHLITPTSTTVTGTGASATISANGSVSFTSCLNLSLNGVFSTTYDNYLVVVRHLYSSGSAWYGGRLRLSGTDASATSTYVTQRILADNFGSNPGRETSNSWVRFFYTSDTRRSGTTFTFYGPALAQQTVFRSLSVAGLSNAVLGDVVGQHIDSTAYDGFTLIAGSTPTLSGRIAVYGMRK